MPEHLAALTIGLMIASVLVRAAVMHRQGIGAMRFGGTDRTDFLILPFALFYLYTIAAHTFGWPLLSNHVLFRSAAIAWIGVALCLAGLVFFWWSLVSFGKSFRVGIDAEKPDTLVTDGIFTITRNPIYVAFALMLIGQFLIFPNWIPLIYLIVGIWLFNRQVLREEAFLVQHYGEQYRAYCKRVRRYL